MLFLSQPRFGPPYRFDDTDLFSILDFLHLGKRVGRERISEYLEMGEGSTRKLVGIMRDYEMLKIEQPGITITRFGKKIYDMTGMRLVDVHVSEHVLGDYQTGVVIKNVSEKITDGVEQRNTGIKTGGYGCTTMVMGNGELFIVPEWNLSKNEPDLADLIKKQCRLEDDDTLIIGGGDTMRKSRVSAVTAALDLL